MFFLLTIKESILANITKQLHTNLPLKLLLLFKQLLRH